MAKAHQLADVVVEATDLLEDLARGIRDGLPPDTGAVETTEETAVQAPEPRYKNAVLNKLDAEVRTAEETARKEVEAAIAAKVRQTRLETARKLCGQVTGLLDQLATAPTTSEPAAPPAAEAALAD